MEMVTWNHDGYFIRHGHDYHRAGYSHSLVGIPLFCLKLVKLKLIRVTNTNTFEQEI